MKELWAPIQSNKQFVDLICPQCQNVEELDIDAPRKHTQHFDYIGHDYLPDLTHYKCMGCYYEFAVIDMFQPTPYDGMIKDEYDENQT